MHSGLPWSAADVLGGVLFPMLGFSGAIAVVAFQVGYCASVAISQRLLTMPMLLPEIILAMKLTSAEPMVTCTLSMSFWPW